ncbi:hypothetical protein EDD80_108149 [Anseongella ginsenosidimutans]|uniref:Uncharacterized protein n=1 Tax=Anseongella ginsenosidimutans TaxID=496056 RepID=A0A4R3KP39_9SPHI|nr:hypothetical protein [Anseongella ginsenosidimutans]QEC53970.1 hypothetical protein FRZ59_17625 [Anseongella ginsenosidimutans]TCS86356.1 hypothetical protein EDD80_108149 [Anseongella ginsenosidimutans]
MEFNPDRYKVFTWKSLTSVLWMLNPLTFLLELGLGQRRPALVVTDKTLSGPETERTIVPCVHCGKLHDARTWSRQFDTSFKNWFGLYCSHCGKVIPCLMSFSSLIVLTLTFPLWDWFENPLKERWMQIQPGRFKDLQLKQRKDPFGEERWLRTGLLAGAFAFLTHGLLAPWIDGEPYSWAGIAVAIPISAVCGLGFSFMRGTNH